MRLYICLGITFLLMFYALTSKSLNVKATLTAGIITFGMGYYGGYYLLLMIALVFFVDKLFRKITKSKSDDTRNEYQILANLLPAYVAIILYAYYDKDLFLMVAVACLAESLADTLASIIGVCAKHHISLKTFKLDEDNASGTISLLGTLASVFGALIITTIYYYFINSNFSTYIIITAAAVVGALIDSLLGTYLQVTYQCSKCKKKVDEPKHCNRKTKKISGFKFITNNMVNFISQIITFIITFVIL